MGDEWISLAATTTFRISPTWTPLGLRRTRRTTPASARGLARPSSRSSQSTRSRISVSEREHDGEGDPTPRGSRHRWYVHDWTTLDNKIRSSIVEGVSVFLSMFDLPAVARVFCPAAPEARRHRGTAGAAAEPRLADAEGRELPRSRGPRSVTISRPWINSSRAARCLP